MSSASISQSKMEMLEWILSGQSNHSVVEPDDSVVEYMMEFKGTIERCDKNNTTYPKRIYNFRELNRSKVLDYFYSIYGSPSEIKKLVEMKKSDTIPSEMKKTLKAKIVIDTNLSETNMEDIEIDVVIEPYKREELDVLPELSEIFKNRLILSIKCFRFIGTYHLNGNHLNGSYKFVVLWELFVEELKTSTEDKIMIRLLDNSSTELIYTKSRKELTSNCSVLLNNVNFMVENLNIDKLIRSSENIVLKLKVLINGFEKQYGHHSHLYGQMSTSKIIELYKNFERRVHETSIKLHEINEECVQALLLSYPSNRNSSNRNSSNRNVSCQIVPNEVSNIDEFISVFETCNQSKVAYPYTLFDFIFSSLEHKKEAFLYLYPQYGNDTVRLFIERVASFVRFGMKLEKTEDYEIQEEVGTTKDDPNYTEPIDGYFHITSISQGDLVFTFRDEKQMVGIFTYVKVWEQFLKQLKNPERNTCVVDIYDYASSSFIYEKSEKDISISQEVNCDCGECLLKNINHDDLIASCESFIRSMTSMFNKFESKYGYHDELHKEFRNVERGVESWMDRCSKASPECDVKETEFQTLNHP